MGTKVEEIRAELKKLVEENAELVKLARNVEDIFQFGTEYQHWYTRALKIVEALATDRLREFRSYYEVDPKRKNTNGANYVIQDYVMGLAARKDIHEKPLWSVSNVVSIRIMNQTQILASLSARIDSVLSDVQGQLFSELQDAELRAASQLLEINARAAGALAGVVLERHLQRVAENHSLGIRKKQPTIADLNDPLKTAGIYDVATWRKIQYLADIRNMCAHQKSAEPTKDQVVELIEGVNQIVKNIF